MRDSGKRALVVHGGAEDCPEHERPERMGAVHRALEAGWECIDADPMEAVLAAIRQLEDEPSLGAGIGAYPNQEGEFELDAGLMAGADLQVGAVAAVRDIRHPIDLARAVFDDGRHVLLVADGASQFGRARGIETASQEVFRTERPLAYLREILAAQGSPHHQLSGDTVGAIARSADGRLIVGVSTGGSIGKLPGRVGDSPICGAGFYADDQVGAAVGTGQGEYYVRLCFARMAVERMRRTSAQAAAEAAIAELQRRVRGRGGVIVVPRVGAPAAAHNTSFMAWVARTG